MSHYFGQRSVHQSARSRWKLQETHILGIEGENLGLRGEKARYHVRETLDMRYLGELVCLVSTIAVEDNATQLKVNRPE